METLIRDLRYALRRIFRNPGFTAIAVLSLALGVGANTAIFTMVNEILLSDPPYVDPQQLVDIYPSEAGQVGLNAISYPEFEDIREGTAEVFDGLVATSVALTQENRSDGSETLFAEVMTGNYFDVLGIRPAVGHSFLPEEDQTPDARPVVMLGHRFWQQRFGGDRNVVGATMRLSGRTYTIVGVAPANLPSLLPGITPAIYAPMMMSNHLNSNPNQLTSRGSHNMFAKARLAEGVTRLQAQTALDRVAAKTLQDYSEYSDEWGLSAIPTSHVAIHPLFDRVLYPAAGVLLAVVGMVLLIACVNLASFLLARAADRRKEIAMRLALGAKRGTLVRQLLTETVVLALMGGAAGVGLATAMLRLLDRIQLPLPVPLDLGMSPDLRVLAFSLALSMLAGIFFGLFPALQSTNPDVYPTLKNESVIGGAPRRLNPRSVLVVAQVSVSFLLLIGSGLFLRSLYAAQTVDPGFGQRPTAITWLGLSPDRYDTQSSQRFYRQVLEQASALPGVEAVGLIDNLALGGTSFNSTSINVDGVAPPPGRDGHIIDRVVVNSGYFEAAGVPLLAGRHFGPQDEHPDSPPVVIISQAMADKFWSGQDAVGKMIRGGDGREVRVIAVARDTNVRTIGEDPLPYIYYPVSQVNRLSLQILARVSANPTATATEIMRIAQQLDRDVMVIDTKTMDEHLSFMLFPFRLGGVLLAIFGGLALLLASIGLYGVVSYSVASRIKEMGIRMSLGARASEVVGLVMKGGLGLVGLGAVIGLLLSLAAAPLLGSLLFGVEPMDLPTFFGVALTLMAVAGAASIGPAMRASRVDPVRALRYE